MIDELEPRLEEDVLRAARRAARSHDPVLRALGRLVVAYGHRRAARLPRELAKALVACPEIQRWRLDDNWYGWSKLQERLASPVKRVVLDSAAVTDLLRGPMLERVVARLGSAS